MVSHTNSNIVYTHLKVFYIIKKAVVRLYIPHRPLKNNYPTRIFVRTYFLTQHDYSGQYAYFFSTIVNPIRLFRPIRLLGIQEYTDGTQLLQNAVLKATYL